jgi:hypothetical protein
MIMVSSPFGALLTLFFVIPFGIVISIYGIEGAAAYRHRHDKSKRHS